jgi:hypothetical protein
VPTKIFGTDRKLIILDIAQQRTVLIIQVMGNTSSSEILVKKISCKAGQFKVNGDKI